MLSRSFVERALLLLMGYFLTYFIAVKIMDMTVQNDFEFTPYNGNLKLTLHEQIVHSSVVKHEDIHSTFDDIIGMQNIKDMLKRLMIDPMLNKKKKPPNGIILHGPPGAGKTMLVKALCKTLKIHFIVFEQNYIEQKMFGESAKIIKALFTLADKLKPCVIFIDEMDGLFGERNALDQAFITNIKTQLLMLIDGLITRDSNIMLIGATNRLNSIDPAFKRRMRTHIHIPLPLHNDRIELFKYYFDNVSDADMNYETLADNTIGFSGSDISEVCKISSSLHDEPLCTEQVLHTIKNCL